MVPPLPPAPRAAAAEPGAQYRRNRHGTQARQGIHIRDGLPGSRLQLVTFVGETGGGLPVPSFPGDRHCFAWGELRRTLTMAPGGPKGGAWWLPETGTSTRSGESLS